MKQSFFITVGIFAAIVAMVQYPIPAVPIVCFILLWAAIDGMLQKEK